LRAAKVKSRSENNLLESTSLLIKSELKIDANLGLAYPCYEQPGPGSLLLTLLLILVGL